MLHPQEIKLIDNKGYPNQAWMDLNVEAKKLSIHHMNALIEQMNRQLNAIGL